MEIRPSARKHGVADADLRHAVEFQLYRGELGEGPPYRVLYLGPDRAGNFLEVVVLETDDQRELAIHAMKMRRKYWQLILIAGGDHE
jgi:hypothetical protein